MNIDESLAAVAFGINCALEVLFLDGNYHPNDPDREQIAMFLEWLIAEQNILNMAAEIKLKFNP